MPSDSPAFDGWLDDFFAAYLRRRPVNATFIGHHERDDRLPDFSESGAGDTLAEIEALRTRLDALPSEPLDGARSIDRRLARGFLDVEVRELRSRHFHRGNPSLYTGEAAFGVLSLLLTDFAPLERRVEAATARLEAVPAFLTTARDNVRAAPRGWTARAARECRGMLALFRRGLARMAVEESVEAPSFRRAAERAAAAVQEHRRHLEALPERSGKEGAGYACGEEMLTGVVRDAHFLDEAPRAIAERAGAELDEAAAWLAAHASDHGAADPAEALGRLRTLRPAPERYYARYGELWEEVRERVEALGLLSWPDFPLRYVPRPGWVEEASSFLYFLSYRSPAAYGRPAVHDYLVPPVDASPLPDDATIKLNHVVHHGGIGHHVQNWHAFQSPSRIGRVAAVDCASRIAMACGGTMAEGWACYATDLVRGAGMLTPLEAYAEVHGRVRMCARAVVDVGLHTGEMTLDDAVELYQEQAGMTRDAARGEAVKNSMFPGCALMYMTGTDAIHALRGAVETREGSAFDLRSFHDRFLSHGSVPVSLVAESMLGEGRVAGAVP